MKHLGTEPGFYCQRCERPDADRELYRDDEGMEVPIIVCRSCGYAHDVILGCSLGEFPDADGERRTA